MNRRHLLRLAGSTAIVAACAAPALACGGPPPVRTRSLSFAPGSNAVEVRDQLMQDLSYKHRWLLTGKPDQLATAKLESENGQLTIRIDEGDGKMPKWGAVLADGDKVMKWQGKVPASGRVMIEVAMSKDADKAPYVLNVALDGAAPGKDGRS